MGAHSLGKAARANSGFTACTAAPGPGGTCPLAALAATGKWVAANTRLTSDYFVQLLRPWSQIKLAASGAVKDLWAWVIPNPANADQRQQVMMNVDIGLVRPLRGRDRIMPLPHR